MASFIIASDAAAAGMQVVMFFTFWGLKAIGPSRLNMGGMGRWMFNLMMKQKGVTQLPELREAAMALGVQLLPCQTDSSKSRVLF